MSASSRESPGSGSDEERPSISNREELVYLLAEAAELEHGLMCSYLFAAFSLRRDAKDLTDAENQAIRKWRASIRTVAMEEMLHLVLVQNLLAAIGAAPHMQRPNFPIAAGLYPSGVVLQLARFDAATLDHFIFLERPEDAALGDATECTEQTEYTRTTRWPTVTPSAQDYPTVGALYRGIEAGFERLAESLGEKRLFLGDPRAQVESSLVSLEGLHAVTDMASVHRAIGRIIEQGEGGRRKHDDSHFDRFQNIRVEFEELVRLRPEFDPAHPVVTNPVMNAPADRERCVHVNVPSTARVLDVATGAYALMVQLLASFFSASRDDASRRKLGEGAILLMTTAIAPFGELLATLPANTSMADRTAGFSFTLPRSIHALPLSSPASILLHERATQVADACSGVAQATGLPLTEIAAKIHTVAALLARL
jgi:hypothetical protein